LRTAGEVGLIEHIAVNILSIQTMLEIQRAQELESLRAVLLLYVMPPAFIILLTLGLLWAYSR
jgi:hypothetical protein